MSLFTHAKCPCGLLVAGLICLIMALSACSDSHKETTGPEVLPPHLGRYMGAVQQGNYGSALIVVSMKPG